MENVAYMVAASLSLLAAAVHGFVGERLVVQRLNVGSLPRTPFGGPGGSMVMIRVSWHIVTLTFAAMGGALLLCSVVPLGTSCDGIGRLVSVSFLGFLILAVAVALARRDHRLIQKHPAPLAFAAVAILAWLGSA